jgi:transposase
VIDERLIGERFRALAPELSERGRRIWAASEARALGRGGIAAVSTASGISPNTIRKGIREIDSDDRLEGGRVRRRGGGRKPIAETDPELIEALELLVVDDCRGDPMQVLLWTSKSVRHLAGELRKQGHEAHYTTVAALLRSLGYSLQSNRKSLEGAQHPDRDAQFRHINDRVAAAITAGEPAISIDTKKKELVGEFANRGREWRPRGKPIKVSTHDFPSQATGKAIPYGVYDIAANEGFVNVGITAETAQLAVASIKAWWEGSGPRALPRRGRATDHRRLRRGQRQPHPAVEDRVAAPRRRHRPADLGLPLPARHLEVEQNRAPPVLSHQPKLARTAADQLRGRHQLDRGHDNQHRLEGLRAPGRARVPQEGPGHRRPARRRQPHARPVSPGVELLDLPTASNPAADRFRRLIIYGS